MSFINRKSRYNRVGRTGNYCMEGVDYMEGRVEKKKVEKRGKIRTQTLRPNTAYTLFTF